MRAQFAVICCLISAGLCYAQGSTPGNDEAPIREIVNKYVDARERNDPKAVEALFTNDADQLVSSGEWRRGREALVTGALASSASSPGSRAIDVERVRPLGKDVAIADARYEIGAAAGAPGRSMWSTFVLERQTAGWRISAIRNMLPAPAPR